MSDSVDIKFTNTMTKRMIEYKKRHNLKGKGGTDFKALQKMGLHLLSCSVNGSSGSSRVPPIMTGMLRGSGTVFVGDKKIGDMKNKYKEGTPSNSYDGKSDTITIGFNTEYAAKLHETQWTPGGVKPSKAAKNNPGILADVGNKWVEQHIKADGKALTRMYALIMQKEQNV